MLRAALSPHTRRRPRRVKGRCTFKLRFAGRIAPTLPAGIKLQDIIGPLNANYK